MQVILTILVVNNSSKEREELRAILENYTGCDKVICASTNQEAMNIIKDSTVDCIICDWNPPHVEAEKLHAGLRAIVEYRDLPFIVSCDSSLESIPTQMAEDNRLACIHKPFGLADLTAKFGRVLPFQDRRRTKRYSIIYDHEVTLNINKRKTVCGKIVNISSGGILVEMPVCREFSVGDEVDINMVFYCLDGNDYQQVVRGKGVRAEISDQCGKNGFYAFMFLDLAQSQQEFLNKITSKLTEDMPDFTAANPLIGL